MKQYHVTGMNCAACSARVEKAVSAVEGVTSCSVNLLTNSMSVEGSAPEEAVIQAVQKAGYGISSGNQEHSALSDRLENPEIPKLKRRFISSLIVLLPLMWLSMGHIPEGLTPTAQGILEMFLSGLLLVINQKFFISGFQGLIHRAPNMDTLVAMGSGVSFLRSVHLLFLEAQTGETMPLYFESAGMIVTLITVGKLLEAVSKGKTTNALRSLLSLAPQTACVIRDGKEQRIPAENLQVGEIFLVRAGESFPADGIILEGESAVDESALTGESLPVDKKKGDAVSAATLNQSGFLRCEAVKVGGETSLSKIIQMVSDASATKAPIARIADIVSGWFVPVVTVISLITFLIWIFADKGIEFAFSRAIAVLVISCPCALGLATPVAVMVGSGKAAKHGILFKTASVLETAGHTEIIALDKTGTITSGKPSVTAIYPAEGTTEEELLTIALSLEQKSEHPFASAILEFAEQSNIKATELTEEKIIAGRGLQGRQGNILFYGGNQQLIQEHAEIPKEMLQISENCGNQGQTPLYFASDEKFLGIITCADTIRKDSPKAIKELQNMGIHVVMLTGDNERTANAVGKIVGVDEIIAGVLPDGKEAVIRKLAHKGKVAMVGDGINDAPALTRADIGFAISSGTDIAIDAADIVLLKNSLQDVPAAIRMSRKTLRNIHENLFWAFIYNLIGIPLAAGFWIPFTGWELPPMFGALAMSLSSFCVVMNALRLNFTDIYSSKHDKPIKKQKKEGKPMTKTLKIEGMMCPHCEASVRKALEALDTVISAEVSHEKGTAVVTLSGETENSILRQAVEAKDYKVLDITA